MAAYQSLITLMDSIGMGAIVNMNGGTGQALDAALKAGEAYRDRVATFITFSPDGINEPGWSRDSPPRWSGRSRPVPSA